MAVAKARPAKWEPLTIRIQADGRSLIDRAAKARGKSRTDFMLDAALLAAQEVILDQTLITVTPRCYAEFLKRLDAPPRPNRRLRKTMLAPPPWKESEFLQPLAPRNRAHNEQRLRSGSNRRR
jgi:uncharacterized protein (DUF1778 family)